MTTWIDQIQLWRAIAEAAAELRGYERQPVIGPEGAPRYWRDRHAAARQLDTLLDKAGL